LTAHRNTGLSVRKRSPDLLSSWQTTILKSKIKEDFDKEDYDPDEHVKIYTLEELAARFNDQMLDDQEWWLVITDENSGEEE